MKVDELTEPETAPAEPGQSLLAQLPRTRPQRSSARRTAARAKATPSAAPAKPRSARSAKPTARAAAPARTRTAAKPKPARKAAAGAATKPTAVRASAATAKAKAGARAKAKASTGGARKVPARAAARRRQDEAPVPLQGYASADDTLTGPVPPPGGAEFVATAAEIFGELAKAGASGGERVVKGLLSRFRLS